MWPVCRTRLIAAGSAYWSDRPGRYNILSRWWYTVVASHAPASRHDPCLSHVPDWRNPCS